MIENSSSKKNKGDFVEHIKTSDEFSYVRQFDTIEMMRRLLTKSYKSDSKYLLKKIDIITLLLVGYFPHKSMSFYSHKLNLEKGSFTYISKKIQDLGLIDLVQHKTDKRKKVLVLTKKGEDEVIRLRSKLNNHISDTLSVLNEEEISQFFESMEVLNNLFKKIYEKGGCNKNE